MSHTGQKCEWGISRNFSFYNIMLYVDIILLCRKMAKSAKNGKTKSVKQIKSQNQYNKLALDDLLISY